jgi:hypothetical protein
MNDDSKKVAEEKPESKQPKDEQLQDEQLERVSGGAMSYSYHNEV